MQVQNCVIDNASWWGILTGFSENVVIQNNRITNTQVQHGIYVGNSADNPASVQGIEHSAILPDAGGHRDSAAPTVKQGRGRGGGKYRLP